MRSNSSPLRPALNNHPRTDRRRRLRIEELEAREVPSVSGVVFKDLDGDGVRGSGDTGLSGVTVNLFRGDTLVSSVDSGADGTFTFDTVDPSTAYQLRIDTTQAALAGFALVPADQGSDDTVDSDATDNGTDATIDFATDDANGDVAFDAGFAPAAAGTLSLGDLVFADVNDNGTFDAGESGVPGVEVELLNDTGDTVLNTTTTDATGRYTFTGLTDGTYQVRIAASNFSGTGALVGFTPSTTAADPVDNVNNDNNGTASGTLGSDGFIASGPITLVAGEQPTDDGDTDPDTNLSVDFGVVPPATGTAGSVAGQVFVDFNNSGSADGPDTGIAGVTITLSGGGLAAPITTQTDSSGNFSFTGLAAGTYTLTETQPTAPANQDGKLTSGTRGGTTTTANVIDGITIAEGDAATGYLFAEVPLVVTGGTVFQDTNGNAQLDSGEPGIPGVTITLTGTSVVDGAISPATATTDAQGAYTFTGLTPGTYTIAETQPTGVTDGGEQNGTPAAATVSNDTFTGIDLTATAAASGGFNFAEAPATSGGTGTISGAVYVDANNDGAQQSGEAGIAGVTIHLTGTDDQSQAVDRTATTDSSGAFSFTGLAAGNYSLGEAQPGANPDGTDTAGSAGGTTTTNDTIGGITMTAGQTATGYLFGEGAASTPTTSAPDLTITQALSSNLVLPGATMTITYTVRNRGTEALTGVTAEANLGGLRVVSANSSDFDGDTGTWTVGDLAAGATETVRVIARAPSLGTFRPSVKATIGSGASVAAPVSTGVAAGTVSGAAPMFWFLSSSWRNLHGQVAGGAGSQSTAHTPSSTPNPTGPAPATPTLALAAASDTGTAGDNTTDLATVTLAGTTTAGASIKLVQTGATTTADSAGAFSFANVPLAVGANTFTAQATNAGGTSAGTATVTRTATTPTNSTPTVATALAPVSLSAGNSKTVDLAGTFDDADIANSTVKFDTSAGPINVELFDRQAPRTVANFLHYVGDGAYSNSIFHRSAELAGGVPFVLQGGGFQFTDTPTPTLTAIPTDPPVQNEPDPTNRSNVKGTLAMAKLGGDPNSATDQFFFNLGDNSANLDTQNGGFTVFGKVVGPADQAAVDQLAAIPTQDESSATALPANIRGAFGEVPLVNYTGTSFPTDTTAANYALINGVSIVSQPEALTYTVVGNTNPTVAAATIDHNLLTVQASQAGTTTLTIQAADKAGATVTTTVTVTVA